MILYCPKEIDLLSKVQILDKSVYVSLHINALKEDINPYLFPPIIWEVPVV